MGPPNYFWKEGAVKTICATPPPPFSRATFLSPSVCLYSIYSTWSVENDVSARPPNLTVLRYPVTFTFHLPTSRSTVACPCPGEDLGCSVSRTVSEIFSVKWSDIETRVGVVQDLWKWRRSIDHYTIFLLVGQRKYCPVYVVPFSSYLTFSNRDLDIWVISHWRSFKLVPFESLGAVSYLPSIVTMSLFSIISEIKRDIGRKSWFCHPSLHSTPPLGGSPLDCCHPVWCRTIRMVGLPDGWKTLRMCITV